MTTNNAKALVVAFIVAALIITGGVLATYFLAFADDSGYRPSSSASDWALFGDYLSGTLGPALSLLAFAGVLCTVWLQARQIEMTKHQSVLEEIQRVLASVSARIDDLLSANCNQNFRDPRLQQVPSTFFQVVSGTGTAAIELLSNPDSDNQHFKHLVSEFKASQSSTALAVVVELDQLASCILKYRQEGGTEHVSQFYWRRYNAVTTWLDALGYIKPNTFLSHLFQPESQRPIFASQSR